MTTFVFIGLSFVSDWWMAMPFYGTSGWDMGFFVYWWKFSFNGE